MWGSGPTDLPALVLWAMQALCHQMTSGKGNSSEQCCLLQVWRAVRQVWEMQEVSCNSWFIHFICVPIRSCWETRWHSSPGTSGRAVPAPGSDFLSNGKNTVWAKLISQATALLVWVQGGKPTEGPLWWLYLVVLTQPEVHHREAIPGDGSNDR